MRIPILVDFDPGSTPDNESGGYVLNEGVNTGGLLLQTSNHSKEEKRTERKPVGKVP
jgi:hypothetical protein